MNSEKTRSKSSVHTAGADEAHQVVGHISRDGRGLLVFVGRGLARAFLQQMVQSRVGLTDDIPLPQQPGTPQAEIVHRHLIIALALLSDRNAKPFDSRSMAFAAMCVAISFALSYVKFFEMPMGGSITFASMLPVMLYSYMFGCRKGVIAGLVYGILQAVQDPWLLHPAQFLLDYGAAFAAVGVTGCIRGFGLFKGNMRLQFTLGALAAGALRFVSHFFSGAFAFGSFGAGYAEEYGIAALNDPYLYSLIYQCMYVIPEIIIVLVTGVILLSSKNFARQVEKYSLESHLKARPAEQPADAGQADQ